VEPGLFVTFFNKDEPRERELPPVGPLDHVVLRPGPQLVAGRSRVHHTDTEGVPAERWLAAEIELLRATGEEPGGMRRAHMRFTSRDGLFVRFVSYADAQEQNRLPELGPYAELIVHPREIEADGRTIANLAVADFATWALTANAGEGFAGLYKPDIALRDAEGQFHPAIGSTPPPGAFAPSQRSVLAPPRRPVATATPRAEEALVAHDVGLVERLERERAEDSLRSRIFAENRERTGANVVGEPAAWTSYRPQSPARTTGTPAAPHAAEDGFSIGEALWRWRFAIIGVLLVGMVTYAAYVAIRSAAPSPQQFTAVNVGQRFAGTRFEWTVNGVQRAPTAGVARAQGAFYLVSIAATNRGGEGAAASPGDFSLIDGNGIAHAAESFTASAYQGPGNASSPYVWPTSFPAGRAVMFVVIFDVDASLGRGNQLAVLDAPTIRVRLD